MHHLLLALAFLMFASTAQAFDIAGTHWANKRGSMMLLPPFRSPPPYNFWAGAYSSNETTTPPQQPCRNAWGQVLIVYETPAPSPGWTLNWAPNVQRKFDYHFHARFTDYQHTSAGCNEETVWAAKVADNPLRLCTIWIKRLASGRVTQGEDVFWSVPSESLPITGPYAWPRGGHLVRSPCPKIIKDKNLKVEIRPAPKNYPVWPPFFGPVWR
jgi:hypothetical protein